jgi:hypothetical protein
MGEQTQSGKHSAVSLHLLLLLQLHCDPHFQIPGHKNKIKIRRERERWGRRCERRKVRMSSPEEKTVKEEEKFFF